MLDLRPEDSQGWRPNSEVTLLQHRIQDSRLTQDRPPILDQDHMEGCAHLMDNPSRSIQLEQCHLLRVSPPVG